MEAFSRFGLECNPFLKNAKESREALFRLDYLAKTRGLASKKGKHPSLRKVFLFHKWLLIQILFYTIFSFHQFLYLALCLLVFFPYSLHLRLMLLTLPCSIRLQLPPDICTRLLRLTVLFQQFHLMAEGILFCLILQPADLLL